MNKELEQVLKAYNQVEEFIVEMPLSYKGYNNLDASEYISDRLTEIEEALHEYVELKKALTPPAEEGIYISKEEQVELLEELKYCKQDEYTSVVNTGHNIYHNTFNVRLVKEDTYNKLLKALGGKKSENK